MALMVGITPIMFLCIGGTRYVVYVLFVISILGIRSVLITLYNNTKEAALKFSFGYLAPRERA